MSVQMAIAKASKSGWYIRCPECRTKFKLDRCPEPGGMEYNAETCPECGALIEVVPRDNA